MNPENPILTGLIKGLQSDKENLILDAISQLYINGTAELIPYVIKLYFVTPSAKIRKEILALLNNLKDKNVCPYLVNAVIHYKGQESYHNIVSSCWQSGLDYSKYLDIFIDLVIEQELLTAIEAFSVVEENISQVSPPERERYAIYIRSKLKVVDEERKNLVNELLQMVQNFSGPFRLELN